MTSRTTIGVILSLLAGVCLSTGGIALRLVESADGFQILFYRALTFVTLMLVFIVLTYQRRTLTVVCNIGRAGMLVALMMGLGAIFYVLAILHTTVANTVVILSTSPLLTAALGWWVLGVRAGKDTLIAATVAVLGVGLMVIDGLTSGGLSGMMIAFAAASCFAVMLVTLQRVRGRDMMPATGLSGLVTVSIAWLAASSLQISLHDAAISMFLGSFQFGLGFVLITFATRYIDGPLVALLTLSEVILAPVWVWLGTGETPTALALAGASFVLLAVTTQAIRALGPS
jgi:drug/metabolite transporter (DMT)-like permease